MAQIIKEIRVDVSQPNVFQAIVAKQLDCNSRFLKITLVDFGVKIEVPKTAKVTINANRPDGKSDSFMGVANNDGTITVPLAQWMLEVAGELKCDVSVINTTDNKRLTSTDFFVNVQEAANKSTDISENPDGEIRVITPTQKIDENSSDDEYPSAKAVYELDNITATASGKVITIESAKAPLQNLKLYGKTKQDGTLGENILPYPYTATTQTINGVTFTDLGDGRIQVSGTASADITYEFLQDATIDGLVVGRTYRVTGCKYSETNINFSVKFNQVSGTIREFYLFNGKEFTAVATSIISLTATLSVLAGQTINTTIHPKLEVASVDLVSVGDSGSFEVGVYGGNLFDVSKISGGSHGTYSVSGENIIFTGYEGNTKNLFAFSYWLETIPNTDYYLTLNSTSIAVIYFYTDKLFGNQLFVSFGEDGKFTFNSGNNKRLLLGFYSHGALRTGTSETVSNIMLNIGTEPLPFEPYKAKQTLTMPYTLRSVGDVKDEVDFNRGVLIQRTNKVVFDGSSDENWKTSTSVNGRMFVGGFTNDVDITFAPLCNQGVGYPTVNNTSSGTLNYCGFGSDKSFYLNTSFSTVAEWKTHLQANPITVIYELATPIETPLTETELNAYRQLMTNKGTTTILSECEDTEVTYYINKPNAQAIGSLHEQINKDYIKLQQAIISTGGSTL
jgi:hypothetical protein